MACLPRYPEQQGIALALLLWMLAAMSLLVAGVIALSRSDVQLTALQLDQARAQAVAIGAANLVLRDLYLQGLAGETPDNNSGAGQVELGGFIAQVNVIPARGLVNLNTADVDTLASLLRVSGDLDSPEAVSLAEAIIEWRSGPVAEAEPGGEDESGRGPFRVEEEVLEVPGMSRDLYQAMGRYVHTQDSVTEFDLLAVPESLLNAWRAVDPDAVDFALKSRQDDARSASSVAGPAPPTAMAAGGVFCIEVDVRIAEGRVFRQRIWVDVVGGSDRLPWRFRRVYPLTLLP